MVEDRASGRGQPKHIINFALLIRREIYEDGYVQDLLRSENQGIPDADIILKVQCWLDMVKERFTKDFRNNFSFDSDNK